MQLDEIRTNKKIPNAINLLFLNNNLYEGKEALEALFNSLKADSTFKDFAEYKVIMVSAI
ncbi:MAG: hypothetical protein WDN66_03145, partial [Candidatus Saccharibacteria bacterium]